MDKLLRAERPGTREGEGERRHKRGSAPQRGESARSLCSRVVVSPGRFPETVHYIWKGAKGGVRGTARGKTRFPAWSRRSSALAPPERCQPAGWRAEAGTSPVSASRPARRSLLAKAGGQRTGAWGHQQQSRRRLLTSLGRSACDIVRAVLGRERWPRGGAGLRGSDAELGHSLAGHKMPDDLFVCLASATCPPEEVQFVPDLPLLETANG